MTETQAIAAYPQYVVVYAATVGGVKIEISQDWFLRELRMKACGTTGPARRVLGGLVEKGDIPAVGDEYSEIRYQIDRAEREMKIEHGRRFPH